MNNKNKRNGVFIGVLLAFTVLVATVAVMFNFGLIEVQKETTASPTTTTEATTEPKITLTSKITLRAAGDVLIHIPIFTSAKTADGYNFDFLFEYTDSAVKDADYFIANLETTFGGTEDGRKYSGFPRFNCPDGLASSLKKAGFDLMLTANNHTYDTNYSGVIRTQDVLNEAQLPYTGTQKNENDKKYYIANVKGIKLGIINYTYETATTEGRKALNGIIVDEKSAKLINSFHYESRDKFYTDLKKQISLIKKEGAEKIITFLHWGEEYQLKELDSQKVLAKKLCEMGVDVLVGGHPHVVEPVDLIESSDGKRKMVCVYSLGNMVSNQRREYMGLKTGHTEDGLIFEMNFSKYSDGTVILDSVKPIPTWVHLYNENGKKIYNVVPLKKNMNSSYMGLGKSASGLSKAEASYERTMTLVKEGIKKCNAYLSKQERPVN